MDKYIPSNIRLMNEVRRDAFEKSQNAEQGEQLFCLIDTMLGLLQSARKEGMLHLEIAVKEIPQEIRFYRDIQLSVEDLYNGCYNEDLIEILTNRYWAKHLQGEDALLYYMMILSVLKISLGEVPYWLERLLVSCLSDEAAERYSEYKKIHTGKECE